MCPLLSSPACPEILGQVPSSCCCCYTHARTHTHTHTHTHTSCVVVVVGRQQDVALWEVGMPGEPVIIASVSIPDLWPVAPEAWAPWTHSREVHSCGHHRYGTSHLSWPNDKSIVCLHVKHSMMGRTRVYRTIVQHRSQ